MENKDFEMALAFQRGEERGFTHFFNLLRPNLIYYAFRILKDKDEAEDVVGESFIKIWDTHHTFTHPRIIKSWLYSTTRNRCLNQMQRNKLMERCEAVLSRNTDIEPSHDENIIRAEVIGELYKCVESLPKQSRTVIKLHYFGGIKLVEIAKHFGVSKSTIKTLKHRGMELLTTRMIKINKPPELKEVLPIKEQPIQPKIITPQPPKVKDIGIYSKIVFLRNLGYSFLTISKYANMSESKCKKLYSIAVKNK